MPTIDASSNYLMWTNPVAVTYVSKSDAGDTTVRVAYSLNQALRRNEVEGFGGDYSPLDRVVNLPTALLGGVVPKRGDRLTYDAETLANGPDAPTYRVLEAQRLSWGHRWRLVLRDPVLVYGLRDTVTIRRFDLTTTPGTSGEATVLHASLPAAVQLFSRDDANDGDTATLGPTYRVAVAEDISDVRRQDQVELEDGRLLEIFRIETIDRLDRLTVLTCGEEI